MKKLIEKTLTVILNTIIKIAKKCNLSVKDISDGYHSFGELYEFRKQYNAAFFNLLHRQGYISVCKSHKHSDGELCFGGDYFIVVANLPTGQISNHYKLKDYHLFQIPKKDVPFKYDGHSSEDVIHRLRLFNKHLKQ